MTRARHPTAAELLARLKVSPDAVTYSEHGPIGRTQSLRMATYGVPATAEIFVVVTDGNTTRARAFISRHKNYPPDLRRKEMSLVDTADACALARAMTRHWPYQTESTPLGPLPPSSSEQHAST